MSRAAALAFPLAALVLVAAAPAQAEGPTSSMSVWRIQGHEAEVRAWVPVALARRFGAVGEGETQVEAESFARAGLLTGDYLSRRLVLRTSAGACAPVAGGPQRGTVDGAWIVHTWRVRCGDAGGWRLRDDAFFEDAPSHAHFARVWIADGEPIERVLTSGERELEVDAPDVGSWRATALERARRAVPLAVTLALAVLASGGAGGFSLHQGLGAAVGLLLGATVPSAGGVGVDVVALAILGVVVVTLGREPGGRALGATVLATCGVLVARHGPSEAMLVALGVVGVAVAASLGRSRHGIVEAVAGLLLATSVLAGEPAPALGERALVAVLVAAPLVVLCVAARYANPPRCLPSWLGAGVVAVTLGWIGLAVR